MRKKLVLIGAAAMLTLSGAGALFFFPLPVPAIWPFAGQGSDTATHESPAEPTEHAASSHKSSAVPEIRQETHDEAGDETADAGKDSSGAHALELAMPQNQSRIVELVRKLHLVQSAAAAGTLIPNFSQRDALRDVEAEIANITPDALTDQELQAMAVYVLSGGDPKSVKVIIQQVPKKNKLRDVLAGAVAFAEARRDEARKILTDLDLTDYPRNLAARLALAQAQLLEDKDFAQKAQKFMIAANLSPGTLVEEAASRRMVTLLGSKSAVDGFLNWAERYSRRFSKSLYMAEFEIAFSVGLLRLEKEGKRVDPERLVSILKRLNRASSTRILLKLSQKSAVSGLQELCVNASAMGLQYFSEPGEVETRFRLYKAACSVVKDTKAAVVDLIALNPGNLAAEDSALRNNAVSLARAILADGAPAQVIDQDEWPEAPDAAETAKDPLLVSVAQQLEATKSALTKADQ